MNLGDKIKQRRLELDMTLDEVAKIAKVSKSTVLKWETGDIANMRRDKIVLLAKALNVSPMFFLDEDYEPSNLNTIAAHLPDDVELTEKEKEEITNFAKYVISKRKGNKD